MSSPIVRRTVGGMLVGGGAFAAVSLYQSAAVGQGLLSHLGIVGVMAVIGATVGGLAGPLVGAALARRRRRGP